MIGQQPKINVSSLLGHHSVELEYIQRMTDLREETLIKKGFLYFILPSLVLGLFGCFEPIFYVMLPVHETDTCLCSFVDLPNRYALLNSSFGDFKVTNIVAFLVFNWFFLVVLLLKIYRIRHINDETLIKKECGMIVGVWISFSIL
jgi:hypothetical protein